MKLLKLKISKGSEKSKIFQSKATFAAGCFWHIEAEFRKLKGIINVTSGYSGGITKNPKYGEVCTGKTGHAESVLIEYDPSKVSYNDLLNAFWGMHDPTTVNRQGPDIGTQYRSAIFYHNDEQKKLAEESKKEMQKKLGKPIATEIKKVGEFYKAEEYHQRYYEKNKVFKCG
jgi:peptide-methionine (S)-S-oxide reductase